MSTLYSSRNIERLDRLAATPRVVAKLSKLAFIATFVVAMVTAISPRCGAGAAVFAPVLFFLIAGAIALPVCWLRGESYVVKGEQGLVKIEISMLSAGTLICAAGAGIHEVASPVLVGASALCAAAVSVSIGALLGNEQACRVVQCRLGIKEVTLAPRLLAVPVRISA